MALGTAMGWTMATLEPVIASFSAGEFRWQSVLSDIPVEAKWCENEMSNIGLTGPDLTLFRLFA